MKKQRWHLKENGAVGICRALSPASCPRTMHFESSEEAHRVSEEMYEAQFGYINPNEAYKEIACNEALKDKNHAASILNKLIGVKSPGFQYECYCSHWLAEKEGLDSAIILKPEGFISLDLNSKEKQEHDFVFLKKFNECKDLLLEKYKELGAVINNEDDLIRAMYYSKDSDTYVIQSGGPNVLDGAIIKNGQVKLHEIKKTHEGGAQLNSHVLKNDLMGKIDYQELKNFSPEVQSALRVLNTHQTVGQNPKLKVSNEEAMRHFVSEYKAKGGETFIYTDPEGHVMVESLEGNVDEVANRLCNKGLVATINLRGNQSVADLKGSCMEDRFDLELGHYFKSGNTPQKDEFTLGEINREYFHKSKRGVRLGEVLLPIKWEELSKLPDDYKIHKQDLQYFPLTLTGVIKFNKEIEKESRQKKTIKQAISKGSSKKKQF